MLQQEVMEQFVRAERELGFPSFVINYPVDARMSVYRSGSEWAVLVETLVFNTGGSEARDFCRTELFCFGSNLPEAFGVLYPHLCVTEDGPSGPLFDRMHHGLISSTATDMTIRGKVVPITLDPGPFADAGIELELLSGSSEAWAEYSARSVAMGNETGTPPRIQGYELLRLIAPRFRDLFFATDAERGEWIGKPMPLLLSLSEWRHPDSTLRESVADSESFRMIAEVIAKNDPSLYRPTVPPNTHWRNWPTAGTIV